MHIGLFPRILLIGMLTFITAPSPLSAQSNAGAALTQLSQAMFGSLPVQKIVLSGQVAWTVGTSQDSGQVTLTADVTGNVITDYVLAKSGEHKDVVEAGPLSACTLSLPSKAAKAANGLSCWRPTAWFYPAISLQPASLLSGVGVLDLGDGKVGSGTCRHLQSQLVLAGLYAPLIARLMTDSTTDIGLDSSSFLPTVLRYSVHPDDGSPPLIPIEIHFSNYQRTNGIQVPFLIEKYVNGALQSSITVTSTQID